MTGRICFTTRDLAECDSGSFRREAQNRSIIGLEMSPLTDMDLDIDLSVVNLDRIAIACGSLSPLTGTPVNGIADVLLGLCDRDFVAVDADGERHGISAGNILLMSLDQISALIFPEASVVTTIHLDRSTLLSRVPNLEHSSVRCITAARPGVNLLFSYARALHQSESITAEAVALASRQILDLAAFVVNAAGNPDAVNGGESVRKARFLAARRDVEKHFSDPTFSIHDVAARQKVTARYLQILFDENGTTFTSFLQGTRLDFAQACLRHATSPIRILDIALEAGFAELSTFNRLFRKRFGNTPSSFRNSRHTLVDALG